ncbi:GGDEF domain-containing protein [Paraglaciecola sp. 20A4]|uniref:sensor domain-containing diguanylate cyclase n=1 Tax=Paraglaciecola sp. 20A4 TaxID=2687288 RepID=UPI00140D9A9D|nr:GGDEF domain-containing protein [Paraglaciecola sp. 20A4]
MNEDSHLPVASQDKVMARISLSTVFAVAFISIFVIFISVTILAYSRLSDFREILDGIANESLPHVVFSEQVNSHITTLTTISDGLSFANSEPALRIAKGSVNKKISDIRSLAQRQGNTQYLDFHLNAIESEIFELETLALHRIKLAKKLAAQEKALYALNNRVVKMTTATSLAERDIQILQRWRAAIFEAIALASNAANLSRLQAIRQSSFKITEITQAFYEKAPELSDKQRTNMLTVEDELNRIVLSEEGIFSLKISLLRLSGRVIGRGNFIRSLISDYSRLLNFKSYQMSDSLITQTRYTSMRIKEQIENVGVYVVGALILLLLIVFFIQNRVVRRLVKLNMVVQDRANGFSNSTRISGNDEISDIADTIDYFATTIEQQKKALQQLSLLDGLTAIPNRRALDERLEHELKLATREKWPLSMLMVDVDFFKPYNDNYGHITGDAALISIAKILAHVANRSGDFVARYGGEEFVFILPNTDKTGAMKVADVLLHSVREAQLEHRYSPKAEYITVSIGVATCQNSSEKDADYIQRLADRALYTAKKNGRDQAIHYADTIND